MKYAVTFVIVVIAVIVLTGSYAKTEPLSLMDQNMDIVKLSFFAFKDGDWAAFSDLHSPSYLQHSPGYEDPITFADYELAARIVRNRLPGLQIRIVDIFAAKNKVAVRSIWEYFDDSRDFKLYYPSGVAQGSEISIFRIKDGKIIEEWCEHDTAMVKRFAMIYHFLDHSK